MISDRKRVVQGIRIMVRGITTEIRVKIAAAVRIQAGTKTGVRAIIACLKTTMLKSKDMPVIATKSADWSTKT